MAVSPSQELMSSNDRTTIGALLTLVQLYIPEVSAAKPRLERLERHYTLLILSMAIRIPGNECLVSL